MDGWMDDSFHEYVDGQSIDEEVDGLMERWKDDIIPEWG